jgi:hypothetical protein
MKDYTRHGCQQRDFDDLARHELRLADLARDVLAGQFSLDWRGWHRIQLRLKSLVGHFARRIELRSSEHWDIATKHLLDLHERREQPRRESLRKRRRCNPGLNQRTMRRW